MTPPAATLRAHDRTRTETVHSAAESWSFVQVVEVNKGVNLQRLRHSEFEPSHERSTVKPPWGGDQHLEVFLQIHCMSL